MARQRREDTGNDVELRDPFGRRINYLRVSVTDRCNLRCVYCMPPQGVPWRPREEMLTFDEIVRVIEAAAQQGVSKVRLTGGEPLIRKGIVELVRSVAVIPGIQEVSMTTNGLLLERFAEDLKAAGLRRVNVSLDTLRPERFARMTRFGDFSVVWRGILAAEAAGLTPIKLNIVVVRGLNDEEVVDMARLTFERPWNVRFIELMPLGNEGDWGPGLPPPGTRFVPMREVAARVAELGELEPVEGPVGNGPARIYRLPGAVGTIGFITPITQHFCETCNRLRLTSDGRLRPCLLNEGEVDVRAALRRGASREELQDILRQVVACKPQSHRLDEHIVPHGRPMSALGG